MKLLGHKILIENFLCHYKLEIFSRMTIKLDHFKLLDSNAISMIGAVAKATGQNIENHTLFFIGKRTKKKWLLQKRLNSQRKKYMKPPCALKCKAAFEIFGRRERVEMLVIHVIGRNKKYLLEATKIPKDTGQHMA